MITPADRIGLAGRNGAGKSTLMKIIAGFQKSDTGSIVKSKNTSVGYLTQHLENVSDRKVVDEAKTAFKDILHIPSMYGLHVTIYWAVGSDNHL